MLKGLVLSVVSIISHLVGTLPNVYKRMSKASPSEWEKAYGFTLNGGKSPLWLFPMEFKVTDITLTDAKTKEEKPVIAITYE